MRFRTLQIYGKLWSILLGHFIKHDFHISEECSMVKNLRHCSKILTTSKVHTYLFIPQAFVQKKCLHRRRCYFSETIAYCFQFRHEYYKGNISVS